MKRQQEPSERRARVRYARKIRDAWIFWPGHSGLNSYLQQLKLARALSDVDRNDFMLARERRKYDKLPDEFVVYRGVQAGCRSRKGMSWSLDRNVAEMFCELNDGFPKGKVIERLVKKSDIFAVIDNDEQEVIILAEGTT